MSEREIVLKELEEYSHELPVGAYHRTMSITINAIIAREVATLIDEVRDLKRELVGRKDDGK